MSANVRNALYFIAGRKSNVRMYKKRFLKSFLIKNLHFLSFFSRYIEKSKFQKLFLRFRKDRAIAINTLYFIHALIIRRITRQWDIDVNTFILRFRTRRKIQNRLTFRPDSCTIAITGSPSGRPRGNLSRRFSYHYYTGV